jgi:hypothetical protein
LSTEFGFDSLLTKRKGFSKNGEFAWICSCTRSEPGNACGQYNFSLCLKLGKGVEIVTTRNFGWNSNAKCHMIQTLNLSNGSFSFKWRPRLIHCLKRIHKSDTILWCGCVLVWCGSRTAAYRQCLTTYDSFSRTISLCLNEKWRMWKRWEKLQWGTGYSFSPPLCACRLIERNLSHYLLAFIELARIESGRMRVKSIVSGWLNKPWSMMVSQTGVELSEIRDFASWAFRVIRWSSDEVMSAYRRR